MTDTADKLAEALRELLASISGQPKSCGHQFYCICAGDKARIILATYEREKAGQPTYALTVKFNQPADLSPGAWTCGFCGVTGDKHPGGKPCRRQEP